MASQIRALPLLFGALGAATVLATVPGCNAAIDGKSPASAAPGPATGEDGGGTTDSGVFGPGGSCDMQGLMARPENGCTNASCHGALYQGGLDLLSPGLDGRLVGVRSSTDACGGELLVDTENPDNSLLLRMVDPVRFASAPCGVMMPFGSNAGVSAEALSCFEAWVKALATDATPAMTEPPPEFEPVAALSYVGKVKTLLTGQAALAEEVANVSADSGALRRLVSTWLETPEFASKLHELLAVALQQRLVGSLDPQFMRLRGSKLNALRSNLQDSFIRTAVDIVLQGRPFSEVLTTRRWAMTTGALSALAFLEHTPTALRAEKHKLFRDASPGLPTPPVSLAYSVENHVWHLPGLPATCTVDQINADFLFEMLLGFVQCKNQGQVRFDDTLLTDADFQDWRDVDLEPASAADVPRFYDLDALRGATRMSVAQPRIGFFTTPAFLANWETNEDNQFRVTTSQTLIVALGELFSPSDPTVPVRLDGLADEHAEVGTTCYGCHQFLDPMREYFARDFGFSYQRPEQPSKVTPSFSFRGYQHDGGSLADFAGSLVDHTSFASGWVQKLCYWANSQPCSERDPEFLRLVASFSGSGYDLKALLVELMTSPLVTGASFTETYRSTDPFVSITRKQHLCQMLDARLGVPDACGVALSFAGLVPEDEFSRGSAEPVQTSVTGLFHYAAAEKLCLRLSTKLVGSTPAMRFPASEPELVLDQIVEQLMGLGAGNPRRAHVRESLGAHYAAAKATTNPVIALRSAFTVACISPEVMALGL